MPNRGGQAINNAGHNTGNHIRERRAHTAINDRAHLNTQRLAKPHAGQMGGGSNGRYCQRQFTFPAPQFQIFLNIARGMVARDQQGGGRARQQRDMREIRHRVIADIGIDRRRDAV